MTSIGKLEYCFAREKEIFFAQQKQNIPISINDFVEMTIFLCLIYFPFMPNTRFCRRICNFFYLFFFFLHEFYTEIQDGRQKWQKNDRQ